MAWLICTQVTAFLKHVFFGAEAMQGSDKMFEGKLNSKAPDFCCAPFPLFRSCWAC
jgi:hypothetical protein